MLAFFHYLPKVLLGKVLLAESILHKLHLMRNRFFLSARHLLVLMACILLSCCSRAMAKTKCQSYPSPDGRYCAIVQNVTSSHAIMDESIISIRDRSGKLLARQSYTSADHEHGFHINQIQWSQDSAFCVWNRASSGGHSPWHFPTDCFVAHCNSILNLDKRMKMSFSASRFTLTAKNQLQSQRLIPHPNGEPQYEDVLISLNDLRCLGE